MFGLRKKSKEGELPDLPMSEPPSIRDYQRTMLPPIEASQEEIHGLPSFPDSPMKRGFSQSMIKSAVEDEDKKLPELPEWNEEKSSPIAKPIKSIELNEWSSKTMPKVQEKQAGSELKMRPQQIYNEKRPLFIKLDKFREAHDSLVKISEKITQMDELLRMIKDVKAREDEEITNWEKDIESVKARLSFINKEIFENAY